ncbi:MAG: hypothetical protein WAT66_08765 [Actinomycetota bacterium]
MAKRAYTMRLRSSLALAALLAALLPAGARSAEAPDCSGTRLGNRTDTATGVADPDGDMRVFAIQYRQDLAYVESYESFRLKMECLLLDYVVANRSPTLPNVVVLNEDIGLATLGVGTRGLGARTIATLPVKNPQNLAGAIAALGSVGAGYAAQVAYYALKEPQTGAQRLILAGATDTFVRAFMQTFSDLARKYDVYIVASNNQPEFREVRVADEPAAAALIDPDLLPRYLDGELSTVYEVVDDAGPGLPDADAGAGAAGMNVYNKAFMWSPYDGVEPYAAERFSRFALDEHMTTADPRSNLVATVKKTPVTTIERDLLDITDDGDMSVENTGPFPLASAAPLAEPPLPAAARIGFGISLPSFKWGNAFGQPFSGDGCASPDTWMRCLDQRGMTVFLQPEANPGCCWVDYIDAGWAPPAWQALSWMDSAWRAVADPSVQNIRYAITPHMVGNLVDLAFDGQSVIFERCVPAGAGDTCDGNAAQAFVGARTVVACPQELDRCDDSRLAPYAGLKRETIVMAPWVLADDPALSPIDNRERLAARGHEMLAGSRSPFENGYLETAIWADLPL